MAGATGLEPAASGVTGVEREFISIVTHCY